MNRYAFDNSWHAARERLAAIEDWLDPGTIRHLSDRGVAPGWQFLEIGAGGGSVAEWLSEQVGVDGQMLATDLDPRFVAALEQPNREARQHDIVRDPLPEDAFDLVHTWLVLAHLADRDTALDRSISALKPDGWMVAEEMDFVSLLPASWCEAESAGRFTRAVEAHNQVLAARGLDPFYGRRAPGDLRAPASKTLIRKRGRSSQPAGRPARGPCDIPSNRYSRNSSRPRRSCPGFYNW